MRDPARGHLAERREPAPPGGQVERHVEPVAAFPIVVGVVVIEHVDIGRRRQSEHRDQRRDRLLAGALDCLKVGRDQRAVVHRELLRTEEHLGRAQDEDIVAAVEDVAQDDVHKLVHEQRRRASDAVPHQRQIGGFDGAVADEMIAEADHQAPVLARIRIRDRGDLGRRDAAGADW